VALEQALGLARRQAARVLELRATGSLIPLWERTRRSELARTRLSELYGGFTEGFSTSDLRSARALLMRLHGLPNGSPLGPALGV
jgi:predicted ATPase